MFQEKPANVLPVAYGILSIAKEKVRRRSFQLLSLGNSCLPTYFSSVSAMRRLYGALIDGLRPCCHLHEHFFSSLLFLLSASR